MDELEKLRWAVIDKVWQEVYGMKFSDKRLTTKIKEVCQDFLEEKLGFHFFSMEKSELEQLMTRQGIENHINLQIGINNKKSPPRLQP